MEKRQALGKGLSALIPDAPAPERATSEVDIHLLAPNSFQPRGQMDDARLEELAQSIRANGVIQPIVVRRVGDRFHIIAGERRWRAAQRAGLLRVPIVVRDVADGAERSLLELALIENLQREDLNVIEEALAYRRLTDEFSLTQEDVAVAVGKERATVSNILRILKLPADIQADVAAGSLTMGHARALLGFTDEAEQRRVARDVIARGLSVRETELLVRDASGLARRGSQTEPTKPASTDVHTRAAEERLRIVLGTRARIVRKGAGGRIEIDFGSEEELIRIYEQIAG